MLVLAWWEGICEWGIGMMEKKTLILHGKSVKTDVRPGTVGSQFLEEVPRGQLQVDVVQDRLGSINQNHFVMVMDINHNE